MQITFNCWIIFLMEKMSLMDAEKITNIRLQVCEFEPQIIMFYVQSISLFA